MGKKNGEYVEIHYAPGYSSGFDDKLPGRFYLDEFPDELVARKSLELQEVSMLSPVKGRRCVYSFRPTVAVEFTGNVQAALQGRLHKHDYFEIVIVASDHFQMQIESQVCELQQWDVCILNCATRHAERFSDTGKLFYVTISQDYLRNWPQEEGIGVRHSSVFREFIDMGLRDTFRQNKDYILAKQIGGAGIPVVPGILADMRREFDEKRPGYQLVVRGLVYRLLCAVTDSDWYAAKHIDLGADVDFQLANSVKKILDREKRKITREALSAQLNYSVEHIDRAFQKHYGCTIPEYSRRMCIQRAAAMLCGTDQSVQAICRELGYVDRTSFYSLFREQYGCTPAEYRARMAGKQNRRE